MSSESLHDPIDARRLSRRLAILALVCFAMGAVAFAADLTVVSWFPQGDGKSPFPGDARRIVTLAEAYAHGSGILFVGVAVMLASAKRIPATLAAWSLAFGSGAAANVVKLVMARKRPLALDGSETIWDTFVGPFPWVGWLDTDLAGHPIQSFPSGHAAAAAAWTVTLSLMFPRVRWLFAAAFALACAQRVECGAHYLSDVLVGAGLGFALTAVALGLPAYRRAFGLMIGAAR